MPWRRTRQPARAGELGLVGQVGARCPGSSSSARRMTSACSTWSLPSARALRVSRVARGVGEPHRPVGVAAGGLVGDGVPVRGRRGAGLGRASRCGRRGPAGGSRSSVSWARPSGRQRGSRWSRSASIDHTAASATEDSSTADTGERRGDRVRAVRDRCHGSIPALATDGRRWPESLCGQGIPTRWLCTEKWTFGLVRGGSSAAAVVSTSSTSDGASRCQRCGQCGLLIHQVVTKPHTQATRLGPQPDRRRQPDSQPSL